MMAIMAETKQEQIRRSAQDGQVKLVEHDKNELRLRGAVPNCFFCSGDMLPVSDRIKETWRCKDCGSTLRRGCMQTIADNIVSADLYNIEKSKRQGHGGGGNSGRKRKKDTRKRKTYVYPNSDAG